jgi:glycosyltransferase involved in cell wall biosynthesis
LLDRFDIRGYVLPHNLFCLDECHLPVTICRFPDAFLFRGRSLLNAWRTRIRKERYPMPGVEAIVRRSAIVHTFEAWYTYTVQAARACKKYAVPLVITHWDTLPYSQTAESQQRAEIDFALQVAAKILATTEAARQVLLDEGVPSDKIELRSMGVDSRRFCPGDRPSELTEQLGIGAEDFVYLFLGRLAQDKGIRELLHAFHGLCRGAGSSRLKLLLVGKGPERDWILTRAASWGIQDRILVAAPVPYRLIHLWHRLGDVFVFPSIPSATVQEQFGYALVEAMCTGRAVITTSTGGIPEVVGEAARLVSPGDIEGLRNAMRELRDNALERERLGSLARNRAVELYSSTVVAEHISRLYLELLGKDETR